MTNVMTLTTPLLRQTVGFDRFSNLFESLLDEKSSSFDSYPPYNIEKLSQDDYRIVMAVAGFTMADLAITVENGALTVEGRQQDKADRETVELLHRGIATRSFKRSFQLADHIEVIGADMADGLLRINLQRQVPEEKKPRTIAISNGTATLTDK